ncbi:MAG: hypothetical protein ACR2GD_06250 [Pyrinomonadaceae bacterium]
MSFPPASALETPILQELVAVGGAEDARFLYERLINYFPQISENEIRAIRANASANWRKLVQRAARELDDKRLLRRMRGFWTITDRGVRQAEAESRGFVISQIEQKELTHQEIQQMLSEIGESLGFYAETEFEFYDVVWRENEKVSRLSHVFEVQSKGNIDSAFAKLKRAYAAQRSKIYLVIASERDLNRARKSLEREFQDIETAVTILTFSQIKAAAQNLKNIAEILRGFLLK